MTISTTAFRSLAVAATLALSTLGAGAASAATPIDIKADGTVVTTFFAAGVYEIDFVQAKYSGWSFWGGSEASCSDTGINCDAGFTNMFRMVQGATDTLFIKLVDKSKYGYGMYGTVAQALKAYQDGGLSSSTDGGKTYAPGPASLRFTVAPGGENLSFYIFDGDYRDNGDGGVSLSITAVPEPAAWALMIGGFGMAGAMLRRRRAAVTA